MLVARPPGGSKQLLFLADSVYGKRPLQETSEVSASGGITAMYATRDGFSITSALGVKQGYPTLNTLYAILQVH